MRNAPDKLPPHSMEAEQGVLGCVLLDPHATLQRCLRRMKSGCAVFYDLKHQTIFRALAGMYDTLTAIDVITLQERLKVEGTLEQVGGVAYLAALPDVVPSAANLDYYVDIVMEKYFLRQTITVCTEAVGRIYEYEGKVDELLDEVERDLGALSGLRRNSLGEDVAPKFLKQPREFQEGLFNLLFRNPQLGEPGLELPIKFPFRIRRKEATLVFADDGAGKSTLLSYFALHLAAQEPGVCVASFEEPPENSLWRLASQLLGSRHLPETEANMKTAIEALGFIDKRFWFYDFLGISDWRDVLETFRYAAEKHGVWFFILDSVMRIGIPDDDWAQQGLAAAAFAQFAMDHNAHMMFVMHMNKGDGNSKNRARGSKLWTANANNICLVERNVEKAETFSKVAADLANEKAQRTPNPEVVARLGEQLNELKRLWDTHFALRKQRFMGSQQNGSKRFWFDPWSSQFREHWEDPAVNWLQQWKKRESQ